jgi:hypothetical protein
MIPINRQIFRPPSHRVGAHAELHRQKGGRADRAPHGLRPWGFRARTRASDTLFQAHSMHVIHVKKAMGLKRRNTNDMRCSCKFDA